MDLRTDKRERKIIQILDALVNQEPARAAIDPIVVRVERKLAQDSEVSLAWESVPLAAYGEELPDVISSSWVFVLRARANSGPERHPNSRQRMMSYRGSGDLQIWNGERWLSNLLVSDVEAAVEKRWISIPPDTWHQAVVPQENWAVVSFHTVPEKELIEERPDPSDTEFTRRRTYSKKEPEGKTC